MPALSIFFRRFTECAKNYDIWLAVRQSYSTITNRLAFLATLYILFIIFALAISYNKSQKIQIPKNYEIHV